MRKKLKTKKINKSIIKNEIKHKAKNTKAVKKNSNRKKQEYLKYKARNTNPIRVLYKKIGLTPKVMIISNVYKLKKTVIEQNLDIIPYQNVYIICHNKEKRKNMPINILLDFGNISGDFIVVQIERNIREFKSISQENIIWYIEVLSRKSFNINQNNEKNTNKIYNNYKTSYNLSNIYNSNTIPLTEKQNTNFENKLVDVLSNINLTLSYLIKDNDKK